MCVNYAITIIIIIIIVIALLLLSIGILMDEFKSHFLLLQFSLFGIIQKKNKTRKKNVKTKEMGST